MAGNERVFTDRGSVEPVYRADSGFCVKSQSKGALEPRGFKFNPMMGLIVTGISGSGVDVYGFMDGGVRGPDEEGSDESDQEGEGVERPAKA